MLYSNNLLLRRRGVLPLIALGWMVVLLAGFSAIWSHASTPGDAEIATDKWPVGTKVELDSHLPTLVVFVHPECPCARATLTHVSSMVDQAAVAISIISMTPPSERPATGASHGCRDQLEALSKQTLVKRIDDVENAEAIRFGASTSGDCFLYSTRGDLLFRGGVTASRGHLGDNAGLQLMIDRIHDPSQPIQSYPVFGCPLKETR
jgi:hypothetical protein